MPLLVTIPVNRESHVSANLRRVVTELFAPASRAGGHHFIRTWDRVTGADCFQIVVESDGPSRGRVLEVARAHGFAPVAADVTDADVPSPLWNCGFGGPAFDAVARDLCRAVAPVLVDLAAALPDDPAGAYPLALHLMVAHAGATLLESEQRALPARDFGDLLALRMLSFRSHFEGFYARVADPDAVERRYAMSYAALGEQARGFVRDRRDEPVPPPDAGPVRAWVDAVRGSFPVVRAHFRDGGIADRGMTLDDLNRGRDVPLAPTRFHSFMSEPMRRLLHEDPDFLAFRLLTSLLYSSLHTLGFGLVERYLFCYLLARANEDVSGRSTAALQQGLGALARQVAG